MRPALSIVLFTTLAGAAQGLTVVLAAATISGTAPHEAAVPMLWVATAMLVLALASSFFHLGHPLRAWRAALMWRTSWMSREVIVLPAFILVTAAWAIGIQGGWDVRVLAWVAIAGAFLLWYCTAMIYACIRFIQEWAHPLTIVNYVLLGLSSGSICAGALAFAAGDVRFAAQLAPWAIAITAAAWFSRALSLRRNAALRPRSSTQSATGIRSPRVVQKSMGMSAGSFNTREFFHGAAPLFFRAAKPAFLVLTFAAPVALLLAVSLFASHAAWVAAAAIQFAGLLLERWYFFAQAQHPQNIYYQAVS